MTSRGFCATSSNVRLERASASARSGFFTSDYRWFAINQPVIDWVGEEPMSGRTFTYVIEVVTTPNARLMIQLTRVTVDSN